MCFQSILHDDSTDSTMSKTNSGDETYKVVARLLLLLPSLHFYLSSKPELAPSDSRNFFFYFSFIWKAKMLCGKKCEKFFCCLFVWLSRITFNGFSFTLMTSFISFMFKLFFSIFALFPFWVVRAKRRTEKFLATCNNSIFLLLSFRIRHALNRISRRSKSVTNKQKKSIWEW